MFDAPIDAVPVWVGVTLVSLAILGVTASVPTTTLDATAAAGTVDAVATSPHEAIAEQPLSGPVSAQISPYSLTLRHGDERAHAQFRSGPVTPVRSGTGLNRVLRGVPPSRVFDSPAAFERASDAARTGGPVTVEAAQLRVRRVSWGGVDVTLVG